MVRGLVTDDSHIPPLEPAETNEDQRTLVSETCGRAIGCGHHIAEEAPDELAAELRDFFGQPSAEPPRRDPRRRKSPG
jgi:hypothetical protein